MSDWQVGDLALCVDDTIRSYSLAPTWPLERGKIYTVEGVGVGPRSGMPALDVTGDGILATADRFRKIRPDHHEICEPEFVQLLKRSKVSA